MSLSMFTFFFFFSTYVEDFDHVPYIYLLKSIKKRESIEQFATNVFDIWGVGDKHLSNGVVLAFAYALSSAPGCFTICVSFTF